mmetsp:Transcript_37542/g.57588  ORF Transcript_37542/g.57588 Transcript_37542/m.57588 type:complete len:239 (-) Transcript_37542:69-785(-)
MNLAILLVTLFAQKSGRYKSLREQTYEKKLRNLQGYEHVIGVDESGGSGSWAGPLVAAAVTILEDDHEAMIGVDDSKQLTRQKQLEIYDIITSNPTKFAWTVATSSPEEIDSMQVSPAGRKAMLKCVKSLFKENSNLVPDESYAIFDGHRRPKYCPCIGRPMVNGDSLCYTVALASIIAKVSRDRIMQAYAKEYPVYGFDKHRGHGTMDHLRALHIHGPSPIHRKSVKAVKERLMPLP